MTEITEANVEAEAARLLDEIESREWAAEFDGFLNQWVIRRSDGRPIRRSHMNADFIAASPQLVTLLLARLAALEARNQRLDERCREQYRQQSKTWDEVAGLEDQRDAAVAVLLQHRSLDRRHVGAFAAADLIDKALAALGG